MPAAWKVVKNLSPRQEVIYARGEGPLREMLSRRDQEAYLCAGHPLGEQICKSDEMLRDEKGKILVGLGEGFLYRRRTAEFVRKGKTLLPIFEWCFRKRKGRKIRCRK